MEYAKQLCDAPGSLWPLTNAIASSAVDTGEAFARNLDFFTSISVIVVARASVWYVVSHPLLMHVTGLRQARKPATRSMLTHLPRTRAHPSILSSLGEVHP